LATSPNYFFFFLAAFLAFLFFAITSLRQKLKKQAQRPSISYGRFDRRDEPGGESSRHPAGRVTQTICSSARILHRSQVLPTQHAKNFQQHCTVSAKQQEVFR
jgi:hypothetical protein